MQEYRDRGALDIRLTNTLPASLLSPNEEIHVLQIVREALSNVIRHAQARQARVTLGLTEGQVQLQVEDDGQGIAGRLPGTHHYGLTIMRERALSLGGGLTVQSGQGGGTRILVSFPPRPGVAPERAPVEALSFASPQETLH